MIKTTRRRIQIDIETHEIVVIGTTGERGMRVCEHCGQDMKIYLRPTAPTDGSIEDPRDPSEQTGDELPSPN